MRPRTLSVCAACMVATAATLLITPARIAGRGESEMEFVLAEVKGPENN